MNLSKTTLLLLAFATIAVLFMVSAAADPGNDNWQEATDIYDGNHIQATVAAAGGGNPADEDWFRVFMTEGQFLKLGSIYTWTDGLMGIRVYGPDDHTRQVAVSNHNNFNAQEIDMFVFGNGTYYVKVYVFGTGATSCPYDLWVRVLTPPPMTDGQQETNSKVLQGGVDSSMWYKVWLEGGNQSVELADVSMTWGNPTETHLFIFDRKDDYALNILNYSVSRNVDGNEKCRFAASYTGWYYIRVHTSTLGNEERFLTTFTVSVDILDSMYRADGNVERADAELVEVRQVVHGKLNQAYDTHEWYKFYLNKDEQFSAKASFTNSKLTIHYDFYNMTLYTWNGTILAGGHNRDEATGSPISSCSLFRGRAPYTGLYYLSLSTWYSLSGSGTTDYTGGKLVNVAKFEIDILIPNRRVWILNPIAEVRFDEDNDYIIDLTEMFWDPEGDELSFGTTGGKTNLSMPLSQSTGLLTIRPNPNWYGSDEITIWAHDGRPDMKNTTKVIITVRSIPDPPFVYDAAPLVVRIQEDEVNTTALNLYNVFGDVDIEDKFLIFSSDKNEYINIEIHQTSGQITLWGGEDYHGEQRLTFYATDSYNYRVSHDIRVIVLPTNDAPVPVGKITRESWLEGNNHHIDVAQFFFDIDEDELYYYASWEPPEAVAFDNAESNPLNSWFDIYPEDPNFYGYIQVTFYAYDRDKLDPEMDPEIATQTAIFEIKNVNDAPRIDAWTPDYSPVEIKETESQVFTVPQNLIYDVDSSSFKWRWFVNDVEMVDATGESFEFPSEPDYEDEGTYIIRCEIKDNLGEPALTSPEWILHIENQNRAPTVYLISKDTEVEEGSDIRLRADGNDPDDDSLIFEWFSIDEAGREHSIGLGREFVYDEALLPGSYRFKCTVNDGDAQVGSEQIQVDIKAHEFPPTVPGFGTSVMVAAMSAALVMAVAMRRRT